MLQSLAVKNFAIIDNVTVDFDDGFTAITGETGSGKSLLIDAIGLLLGDRASSTMVRKDETKAIIEGVFVDLSDSTINILKENDLYEDDLLIIKKEIYSTGKSITRVNGSAVSIQTLNLISDSLADIHTQLDTKKLFEPTNYLNFIDDKNSKIVLSDYQASRLVYLENLEKYENLKQNLDSFKKERDYYEYQYNVITNAKLKIGELETLEEELNLMNNYELIFKNLNHIKEEFDNNNITKALYQISNSLEKIAEISTDLEELKEIVNNAYYDLGEVEYTISNKLNNLEFDNNRYEEIRDRINYLRDLMGKYHKSIPELIEYQTSLKHQLDESSDSKYLIEKALRAVKESYDKTLIIGNKLTELRKENAEKLTNNIKNSLKDLMLDKVKLKFRFDKILKSEYVSNAFAKKGIDDVNIFISFNPGEELKELSKVASGGEMSRVMLAIKTHLMEHLGLSTMIFDEIDSGISGEAAYHVAKKLQEISKYVQVLAITHLPIVASFAENHLHITKKVENNKTKTIVTKLCFEERINEISKLISPNDNTEISKELALQMLKNK